MRLHMTHDLICAVRQEANGNLLKKTLTHTHTVNEKHRLELSDRDRCLFVRSLFGSFCVYPSSATAISSRSFNPLGTIIPAANEPTIDRSIDAVKMADPADTRSRPSQLSMGSERGAVGIFFNYMLR